MKICSAGFAGQASLASRGLLAALSAHNQSACAGSAMLHTRPTRLEHVSGMLKGHPGLYSACIWLPGHLGLAWSSRCCCDLAADVASAGEQRLRGGTSQLGLQAAGV